MLSKAQQLILERWVVENPYIPHAPFRKQAEFLALPDREALYGGSAGSGKSDALLMGSLMFVEVPGYNAILFRKTYADLALPEAIMERSHEWLAPTDAQWNGSDYRWTFPSGATLNFGYLAHDKHKYRYQSAAFQFIGFDELTQMESGHYLYLFSRLRRLKSDLQIPLRMRGGTNPGGVGHHWVYSRFVVDDKRPFIPARLEDNPFIDAEQYEKALSELGETEYRQLRNGEWVLDPGGKPFNRDYWRGQARYNPQSKQGRSANTWTRWISLDTALETKSQNDFTAWTVGELLPDYRLRIRRIEQAKMTFPELMDLISSLYREWNRDDKLAAIIIEGAASGKPAIQSLRAGLDPGLRDIVVEVTPRGSKLERANQSAVWAKRGMVYLPIPQDEWLADFERELYSFPDVEHDDRTDSFTQLVNYLGNFLQAGWYGAKVKRGSSGATSRVAAARVQEGAR